MAAIKQDGWRDTALHYAAGCGSLETVQALLAWGADAAAENALGALLLLRCRTHRGCGRAWMKGQQSGWNIVACHF